VRDLEAMARMERLEAASLLAYCEEGTPARTSFEQATRTPIEWRSEDDDILAAALTMFASGSLHRWGKINTMVIRKRLEAWDLCYASSTDLRSADPRNLCGGSMLVALGDNLRVTEGDACALEAYTEGTRRSPTFCRNYLRMAKMFADKGRLDEAEQIARRGKAAAAAYRDGSVSSVASLSSRS